MQRADMEKQKAEVWSGANFGKMSCAVCGSGEGKRCAGCGSVAYCCKEYVYTRGFLAEESRADLGFGRCQKEGWKAHKRHCTRKKIGQDVSGVKAPFEII